MESINTIKELEKELSRDQEVFISERIIYGFGYAPPLILKLKDGYVICKDYLSKDIKDKARKIIGGNERIVEIKMSKIKEIIEKKIKSLDELTIEEL